MGYTHYPNGVTSFGIPILGSGGRVQTGPVVFIDSNHGNNGYDGSEPDTAFETLAYGFAKLDSFMHGSERGTAYVSGSFDENLTKLVSKSDIIGIGSKSQRPMPRIRGTHVIADEYNGTRLFNIYSECEEAAYNWSFEGGGFEVHNCIFRAGYNDAAQTLGGLSLAMPSDVKIYNSQFLPELDTQFATAAIYVPAIAGSHVFNCQIYGNKIWGTKGIYIATPSGVSFRHSHIDDNFIVAETLTIDDDSNEFYATGNDMISAGDNTTISTVVDYNVLRAARNIITGSAGTKNTPTTSD